MFNHLLLLKYLHLNFYNEFLFTVFFIRSCLNFLFSLVNFLEILFLVHLIIVDCCVIFLYSAVLILPLPGLRRAEQAQQWDQFSRASCDLQLPVYTAAGRVFESSHGRVLIQDLHAFVGGVGEGIPVSRGEPLQRHLQQKQKSHHE